MIVCNYIWDDNYMTQLYKEHKMTTKYLETKFYKKKCYR